MSPRDGGLLSPPQCREARRSVKARNVASIARHRSASLIANAGPCCAIETDSLAPRGPWRATSHARRVVALLSNVPGESPRGTRIIHLLLKAGNLQSPQLRNCTSLDEPPSHRAEIASFSALAFDRISRPRRTEAPFPGWNPFFDPHAAVDRAVWARGICQSDHILLSRSSIIKAFNKRGIRHPFRLPKMKRREPTRCATARTPAPDAEAFAFPVFYLGPDVKEIRTACTV